jgi:hypothetical protein
VPERVTRLTPHVLEVVAVLAAFAAVGAGLGWLWFHAWPQPTGTVYRHTWLPDEDGLRDVFDATAWYVVLAAAGGLLVGALATLLCRRSPVATLVAVVVGSLLAAWVMLEVGLAVSPADPVALAANAADGTKLPGRLSLEDAKSPYLAWPIGALVALMVVNFLVSSRDQVRRREAVDPRWLSAERPG